MLPSCLVAKGYGLVLMCSKGKAKDDEAPEGEDDGRGLRQPQQRQMKPHWRCAGGQVLDVVCDDADFPVRFSHAKAQR
eukprot:4125490-Amphidinium_carterae.2